MPVELSYAVAGVVSYLVGAIPFGFLIFKLKTGKDIREAGSGNIGATNIGRELGFHYFLLVLLLDGLKGFGPVFLAPFMAELFPCERCAATALPVFCGLMAFLGHILPVYLKFKGGKGVATGLGIAVGLGWPAALVAVGVWLIVLLVCRFVAIASVLAGIALPVAYVLLSERPFSFDEIPTTGFLMVGALLILVRHLGNLRRIFKGEEPKVLVKSR